MNRSASPRLALCRHHACNIRSPDGHLVELLFHVMREHVSHQRRAYRKNWESRRGYEPRLPNSALRKQ